MYHRNIRILALLLIASVAVAWGQNGDSPMCRLRSGDVLAISVYGIEGFSTHLRVEEDGNVYYPKCTPIKAAGKNVRDVAVVIQEFLKDQVSDPFVEVFVESYVSRPVYVIGEINGNGRVLELPVFGRMNAIQAISAAGGFTASADLDHVFIQRYDEESGKFKQIPVDVSFVIDGKVDAPEQVLLPEDTIIVPLARNIYVMGQVNNPGPLKVHPGEKLTITRAIALAGGFTSIAKQRSVQIIRGGQMIYVNVKRIYDDAAYLENDIEIEYGDTIVVGESMF